MQTENTNKRKDAGRKTWLLGLGAYDSALKTASGKFDQFYEEGNQVFADLVTQGEALEAELKQKLQLPEVVTNKIEQLKALLSNDKSQELDKLSGKIDALTAMVEKLAEQKAKVQAEAKKSEPGTASKAKVAATKKATTAKANTTQTKSVTQAKKAVTTPAAETKPKTPRAKRTTKTAGE